MRPHSSYSAGDEVLLGVHAGKGVSIQCQFCPGQGFRRSTLRAEDLKDIFLMRYPVRCLRCSQRQLVSFTVAGVSIPAHVKQRRAPQVVLQRKHWSEPMAAARGSQGEGSRLAEVPNPEAFHEPVPEPSQE
jgi:hypothetical protein